MTRPSQIPGFRWWSVQPALTLALVLGGCGLLHPPSATPTRLYTLEGAGVDPREALQSRSQGAPSPADLPDGRLAPVIPPTLTTRQGLQPESAPRRVTLTITPPVAAPGFDSARMVYSAGPHRLEYFAHHAWVDPPAALLAPLMREAIERSGSFTSVVLTPSAAAGDLRLETEVVRLEQDFGAGPSKVRLTLRATMLDTATRQVLAARQFDQSVAATSDDPTGGVLAANQAVTAVLARLAAFCSAAATTWRAAAPSVPALPNDRSP